eukprot:3140991-Pyramimonas_sp.AAC.1
MPRDGCVHIYHKTQFSGLGKWGPLRAKRRRIAPSPGSSRGGAPSPVRSAAGRSQLLGPRRGCTDNAS